MQQQNKDLCLRRFSQLNGLVMTSQWRNVATAFSQNDSCMRPSAAFLFDSPKFTGKERNSESGLDYFGARYMSAAQGRFTTADPYMPSADVKDPQRWNRYVYAGNNPLRYIDPNGLDWSDLSPIRVFHTQMSTVTSRMKSSVRRTEEND